MQAINLTLLLSPILQNPPYVLPRICPVDFLFLLQNTSPWICISTFTTIRKCWRVPVEATCSVCNSYFFVFFDLLRGVRKLHLISWWGDFPWAGNFQSILNNSNESIWKLFHWGGFIVGGSSDASVFEVIASNFYIIVLYGIRIVDLD